MSLVRMLGGNKGRPVGHGQRPFALLNTFWKSEKCIVERRVLLNPKLDDALQNTGEFPFVPAGVGLCGRGFGGNY